MDSREAVITLRNVSKSFFIKENEKETIREKVLYGFYKKKTVRELKALADINLTIRKGEFFGIIGRNGSGKSTLLRLIMKTLKPNLGGEVITKGKIIRLALGMGFDANLSARDNIYVNGSIIGLTFKKIGNIFKDIIRFAELEAFVDTPVKFYSSGMRARLAFSIAIHAEADILLIDEFFGGVGDQGFRQKSEKIFKETLIEGKTIVHVNHRLGIHQKFAERVLVLNQGKNIYLGDPKEGIKMYKEMFKN